MTFVGGDKCRQLSTGVNRLHPLPHPHGPQTKQLCSAPSLRTLTTPGLSLLPQPFHSRPYLFPEPLSFPLCAFPWLAFVCRFQLLRLAAVPTISFALSLQVWGGCCPPAVRADSAFLYSRCHCTGLSLDPPVAPPGPRLCPETVSASITWGSLTLIPAHSPREESVL